MFKLKSWVQIKFCAFPGSSGLSSERIILSPFTKEFRGEGHSYESLIFSVASFWGSKYKRIKSQCSETDHSSPCGYC